MTSLHQRERGAAVAVPPVAPSRRRTRRRWPWVLGGLALLLVLAAAVTWLTTSRARPVSMHQAESGLGTTAGRGASSSRPAPGVYKYSGTGTERLSLPPLSQAEGPTMPGTVTLQGANCWIFKIDYSTHHWQTWQYCLHNGDLWEAGGQSWQLWSIGPLNVTNLSTFSCVARSMALPAQRVPGETWQSRCTGKNSSVGGTTISAGPYSFTGDVTMDVGGTRVQAAEFLRLRTDSGAQNGTERSEIWFDTRNGLVLRLEQDITVTSATPFGMSTYTQEGVLALDSLTVHR